MKTVRMGKYGEFFRGKTCSVEINNFLPFLLELRTRDQIEGQVHQSISQPSTKHMGYLYGDEPNQNGGSQRLLSCEQKFGC